MPFISHKNFQKNVYTINQTDLVRPQPNKILHQKLQYRIGLLMFSDEKLVLNT